MEYDVVLARARRRVAVVDAGNDVLHCPYCHGYEVRDSPIGVLGGPVRELSVHQALLLRQWSQDVVFFPNRIALTADERERLSASYRRRFARAYQASSVSTGPVATA